MITARGVSKSFGALSVLSSVDLDVAAGTVTAIVGPNAAGKTTFNKILLGLVRADGGEITVHGRRVDGSAAYRSAIGYMQQNPRFPENLCAADVFDMLTDLRQEPITRDDELIDTLGIGAVLRTPMRHLSGGTRQRINAALAFLFSPDVLILDEPTASLDPLSSLALKDKIQRERNAGRTFLVTSHILSELEDLADRVVFLLEGRVRFSGETAALKRDAGEPSLERAVAKLMREHAVRPATPTS